MCGPHRGRRSINLYPLSLLHHPHVLNPLRSRDHLLSSSLPLHFLSLPPIPCLLPSPPAIDSLGIDAVEVYHSHFTPLEFNLPHRDENRCYVKIIVNKNDQERVVGVHLLSPHAGEVIQGFAVAMRLKATMASLRETVGIHPTIAEEVVLTRITKRSGEDPIRTGC